METHTLLQHKCCFCKRQFLHENALRNHRCTELQNKPFSCSSCAARFLCEKNLKKHKESHTTELSEEDNTASSDVSADDPVISEDPIRIYKDKIHCIICELFFTSVDKFIRHMDFHVAKEPYFCDICLNVYSTMTDLFVHKISHCEEICGKCACNYCGREFNDYRQLVKHICALKSDGFSCWVCNRSFCVKKACDNHMIVHLQPSLGDAESDKEVSEEHVSGSKSNQRNECGTESEIGEEPSCTCCSLEDVDKEMNRASGRKTSPIERKKSMKICESSLTQNNTKITLKAIIPQFTKQPLLQGSIGGKRLIPILPKPSVECKEKKLLLKSVERQKNSVESLINNKSVDKSPEAQLGSHFISGQMNNGSQTIPNMLLVSVPLLPISNGAFVPISKGKIQNLQNDNRTLNAVNGVGGTGQHLSSRPFHQTDKKYSRTKNISIPSIDPKILKDSEMVSLRRAKNKKGEQCLQVSVKRESDIEMMDKLFPNEKNILQKASPVSEPNRKCNNVISKSDSNLVLNKLTSRQEKAYVSKLANINKSVMEFPVQQVEKTSYVGGSNILGDRPRRTQKKRKILNEEPRKYHKRLQSNDIMKCPFCNRCFNNLINYQNHLDFHVSQEHVQKKTAGNNSCLKQDVDAVKITVLERGKPIPMLEKMRSGMKEAKDDLNIRVVTQSGKNSLSCSKCGQQVQLQRAVEDYVGSRQDDGDPGEKMVYISRFSRPATLKSKAKFQCKCRQDIRAVVKKKKIVSEYQSSNITSRENVKTVEVKMEPIEDVEIKEEFDYYDFTEFDVPCVNSQNQEIVAGNINYEMLEPDMIKVEHDPLG